MPASKARSSGLLRRATATADRTVSSAASHRRDVRWTTESEIRKRKDFGSIGWRVKRPTRFTTYCSAGEGTANGQLRGNRNGSFIGLEDGADRGANPRRFSAHSHGATRSLQDSERMGRAQTRHNSDLSPIEADDRSGLPARALTCLHEPGTPTRDRRTPYRLLKSGRSTTN